MRRPGRPLAIAALMLGLAIGHGAAAPTTATTLATSPAATSAPAPPQAPILRIDAEFHTQVVNRFAQDRRSRIIVTASDDKTIRVWQANDGAPLAILRIPIAPGDEGAIYAVAISPDSKTLLAGGSTGFAWDRAFAIYLFDLATGRLRGRMPNLPGPVNDIAFSPDGSRFALAMGNGAGVLLVDAKSGNTIGADASFRQRVTSIDFDHRGRLFATGFDGEVRLYAPDGRRLVQRTPVRGARPYTVAVSPDGRTVAVGYADQPRVELLNAQDLSPRASLITDPAGRRETGAGGLGAVAWSEDGALMAAGSLRGRDGRTVLRRWPPGGGWPIDVPALRDTIFQVGPTDDGGAVLVGADPALVRLDRNGRVVFRNESPGLDFRDMQDRQFRVGYDGTSVELQTKAMASPWIVDLGQRHIGPTASTSGRIPIASPSAPPPRLADWRNSAHPRIDGRSVRLAPEELSRSFAATPSGAFVVLGTDYLLRVYSRDGTPIDQAELPAAAWAVGVSGDGKSVVAAVGDGTLRWFGLDEAGRLTPRVSLFMASDARRWVAWTQSGFFDYADTGGEGMVGLLLNHARNQAPEWFSFAQVYRRFYAPDATAAALRGETVPESAGQLAGGLAQVRQTLANTPPPAIELRAICWAAATRQCQPVAVTGTSRGLTAVAADGVDVTVPEVAETVSLRYRLRGDEAASSAVDLFVNGHNGGRVVREVSPTGDLEVEQSAALDPGLNRLQLRAYDRDQQTYAQSRLIQIKRTAEPKATDTKPTLYILSVGINAYQPGINQLAYAVPDARAVTAAIEAHVPESYGHAEVKQLYNTDASTTGVLKALAEIGVKATSNDTVLIYFSGHGDMFDGRYYFITQNVPAVEQVTTTALSEGALVTALAAIKSNRTMLFLDTCHAGAFSLDAAGKLAHETGRYILAAAASLEEALDSYDDKNGVFATAVLRGLSGQAAAGRPVVDNFQLGTFVTPLVRELATELRHNQSARFKIAADDAEAFPIVTVASTGRPRALSDQAESLGRE